MAKEEKSILEQLPLWQRKIISTREIQRRKMMSDEIFFFENFVFIENKSGKTADERSILFKMFDEQKKRALKRK